jgi:hypothetical protein
VERNAVFSLQVNNDGVHVPRVDVRWEVLPPGTDGIGERELAILAVNAMSRSTFKHSLHFELGKGNVSALMPKQGSIASLEFNDFSFDSPAVHSSMHGRWIAASKKTLMCGEMRCVTGYVVTYTHNMNKVKIE